METPIRHVRMKDETWDALARLGKDFADDVYSGRTPSWLVNRACEELVERIREQRRKAAAARKGK